MGKKHLQILWLLSLVASFAIVLWFALKQGSTPAFGNLSDKILHAITFLFLAAHCRIALPKVPAMIQFAGLMGFALLIELLQLLLPWRYFSWMDIAADAAGMMIFWSIFSMLVASGWLKKFLNQP